MSCPSWKKRKALLGLVLAVVAAVPSGCSDERQRTALVRGKITYKSNLVTSGTITFVPETPGPSATAEIQKDGTYVLSTYGNGDGAVLGRHKVMIISLEDNTGRLPEERNPLPNMLLPAKYSDIQTSGLTAEVGEGTNEINFPLK